MRLCDIICEIERLAPLSLAESWDNPGLMTGKRNAETTKILVSLDMDENVAREAIDKKCQLVLTHHPMLFHPLKSITDDTPSGRCALMLIENKIAVYSAHTNLDCAKGGTNDYLAKLYGLANVQNAAVCAEIDGESYGIMRVGDLTDKMPLENFAKFVAKKVGTKSISFVGDGSKTVKKVALCSGGGGDFVNDAAKLKADVYVTGDIKYSHARTAAENGLSLVIVQHFDSEKCCMEIFKNMLKNLDVEVVFSETNTNVVKHIEI